MFTMLATLLLSAPAPKLQPTGNPSPEPVLIAKGKGFLIHGVVFKGEPTPAIPPVPQLLPMQTVPLSHGVAILHTTTETGQMKALLTSGLSVHQSPQMGIDHQYYTTTSILGAVADAERLYVLSSFWQRIIMLPPQQPVKELGPAPPSTSWRSTDWRTASSCTSCGSGRATSRGSCRRRRSSSDRWN